MNRPVNSLHELPLERIETTPANPACVIFTFIGIFVIISSGGIIVFWLAYRHGMNMGLAALRGLQPPREEPLPTRFVVNETYLIPSHEYNQSTSFVFAATYLLESYYRNKGISNEYLESNQYVEISRDLLVSHINELCKSSAGLQNTHCKENPFDDHVIFDSSINSNESIYPYASKSLKSPTSLRFSYGDNQVFSGVATTKRSLLITGQPHSMTMPTPMARYWFSCEGETNNNDVCKNQLFHCSKKTYNKNKNNKSDSDFCYYQDFLIEGDFVFDSDQQIVAGPKQELILLAYNDHFIPQQPTKSGTMAPIGGFILKNGRGIIGHSLEYLIGKITYHQDKVVCGDPKNVDSWIPATFSCASSHENVSDCNKNAHVVSGNRYFEGSTELICIDEKYCEKNQKYVLLTEEEGNLTASIEYHLAKTPLAKVIMLQKGNYRNVTIQKLPFPFLHYALRPTAFGESNFENCGYLYYSYDSIRKISSLLSENSANWRVFNPKINWAKKSYPYKAKNINYTDIIGSLRNITSINLSKLYPFFEL